MGLGAATAAVWFIATASAVTAFPPPIQSGRDAAVDGLFVKARDAYLARDWLTAENTLRAVLDLAPTDGEAQLLLATLLRRVGRIDEATAALTALSHSDSGGPWRTAIARELARIATARGRDTRTAAATGAAQPGSEEAAASARARAA
jgi:thioredoxin-like negative regulator of GroEL